MGVLVSHECSRSILWGLRWQTQGGVLEFVFNEVIVSKEVWGNTSGQELTCVQFAQDWKPIKILAHIPISPQMENWL